MRKELVKVINARSTAIQESLETWVREKSILEPGERLVFSLRVVCFPVVEQERFESDAALEMKAKEFFSKKRILNFGATQPHSTTLSHALDGAAYTQSATGVSQDLSVRQLLVIYPTAEAFRKRIPKIAQKGTVIVIKMLEASSIFLPDSAKYLKNPW